MSLVLILEDGTLPLGEQQMVDEVGKRCDSEDAAYSCPVHLLEVDRVGHAAAHVHMAAHIHDGYFWRRDELGDSLLVWPQAPVEDGPTSKRRQLGRSRPRRILVSNNVLVCARASLRVDLLYSAQLCSPFVPWDLLGDRKLIFHLSLTIASFLPIPEVSPSWTIRRWTTRALLQWLLPWLWSLPTPTQPPSSHQGGPPHPMLLTPGLAFSSSFLPSSPVVSPL